MEEWGALFERSVLSHRLYLSVFPLLFFYFTLSLSLSVSVSRSDLVSATVSVNRSYSQIKRCENAGCSIEITGNFFLSKL